MALTKVPPRAVAAVYAQQPVTGRSFPVGIFVAGKDQTANRAITTQYTNGIYRRFVYATVTCTATVGSKAFAGFSTVVGGTTLTATDAVGLPAGVAEAANYQVCFPIDPGANYKITSDVGAGATVTLVQWLEVDS